MPSGTRVAFERPPVVEVACGVLFRTTRPLHAAHVGVYWQNIRGDFPRIEEVPPLLPTVEPPGQLPGRVVITGFGLLPPLRRTWLSSEDGRSLIQVQEDRFLFNWKRAVGEDAYPSYEHVIERFNRYLAGFLAFLDAEQIGLPAYRQFELAYVNQIPVGPTADGFVVRETQILVDHLLDARPDRFLPEPEAIDWTSIYPLPNGEGRLYATARSGLSHQRKRILQLEMTARGIPADPSEVNRQGWFDRAHCWITRGFADITAPDIQRRVWGRTA